MVGEYSAYEHIGLEKHTVSFFIKGGNIWVRLNVVCVISANILSERSHGRCSYEPVFLEYTAFAYQPG
jgi:hypothetical protein